MYQIRSNRVKCGGILFAKKNKQSRPTAVHKFPCHIVPRSSICARLKIRSLSKQHTHMYKSPASEDAPEPVCRCKSEQQINASTQISSSNFTPPTKTTTHSRPTIHAPQTRTFPSTAKIPIMSRAAAPTMSTPLRALTSATAIS